MGTLYWPRRTLDSASDSVVDMGASVVVAEGFHEFVARGAPGDSVCRWRFVVAVRASR